MNKENLKEVLLQISKQLIDSEKMLCDLDSYVGDGDHGVTVARGFKEVEKMLSDSEYDSPSDILNEVGNKLALTMGGAIGPILGSFFSAGAKQIEGSATLDTKEFDILFSEGLKAIQMMGGAVIGDRTMVDALSPATDVLRQAAKEDKNLKDSLEAAAIAAKSGAESTKELVAKKGRAKFLREKSLGYVDAGATTVSIIITVMSDYLNNK